MLIHQITERNPPLNEVDLSKAAGAAKKAWQTVQPHAKRMADAAKRAAAGSGVAQSAQAASRAYAQPAGPNSFKQEYKQQQIAIKCYKFWENYTARYAQSLPDEQARRTYLSGQDGVMEKQLEQFVQVNLLHGNPIDRLLNAKEIRATINQIIHQETGSSQAERSTSPQPGVAQSQPRPPQSTAPPSQPSQPSSAGGAKMSTRAGTKVVSGEPRILRASNQDWIRNNQGEWTKLGTNRVAPEEMQAFLDKEDNEIDTLTEAANPSNPELDLFVQLVRQTSMATTDPKYRKSDSGSKTRGSQYRPVRNRPSNEVESTGNPEADKVLQSAGFIVK